MSDTVYALWNIVSFPVLLLTVAVIPALLCVLVFKASSGVRQRWLRVCCALLVLCISLPLTSVSLIYGWMDMEGRAGEEYYRRNPEPALESDGFPRGENDGLAILVISHFLALCSHLSFFGATILIMASPGIQESALALVTPYPPARSAESEVPAAKLGVKECIVACICIPFRLLYTIYWRLQDRIEGRD